MRIHARDRFFIGLMQGSSPESPEWVFEDTGEHTCGAGVLDSPAPGAHEPYCGVEPVAPLAEVLATYLVASSAGSAGWEHARLSGEYAASAYLGCNECDPSGKDLWSVGNLVEAHSTWIRHRVTDHDYRVNGPGSGIDDSIAALATVIREATDPDGELRAHAVGEPGVNEITEVVGTPESIAAAVLTAFPGLRLGGSDDSSLRRSPTLLALAQAGHEPDCARLWGESCDCGRDEEHEEFEREFADYDDQGEQPDTTLKENQS